MPSPRQTRASFLCWLSLRCKNWEGSQEGWVTEIELKGISPYVENIETELKNFDSELMLFLPHLREVEIAIVNNSDKLSRIIYRASKREPILDENYHVQKRTISKQQEDGGVISQEWLVCWDRGELRRDIGREEECAAYNIEIAVPKEAEQRKSLSRTLYNFLPVSGVRINLPCLIHATVNLGDNRNELLVGNWQNREIFTRKLPDLMKHFAEVIKTAFDKGEILVDDRWLPYSMLAAPTQSDDGNYVGPLYKILRNVADTEAYIPCVDGKFHRANECCYYVPDGNDGCNMLEFFNAHPEFVPNYVLKGVPNGPVPFYTRPKDAVSLRTSVNEALAGHSYSDKILVDLAYILWRIAKRSGWRESGPYWIFHDHGGRRFGRETDNVYTPREGDTLVFPEYMNADFIDEKLWIELLRRFEGICANYADGGGGNAKRTFCNNELHKFLRVEYYDRAAAAKKIISSAIEYLKEDFAVADKRQVVAQLMKALWENFRGDVEPHPRKEKIPIYVKDDGTVQFAGDFLFDDARPFYNGVLGKDVFLEEARLRELISEPDADTGRLRAFFRYLGIRADVRINYVTIGTSEGNSNPYLLFLQAQQSSGKDGGLPPSIANGNALEEMLDLHALRDVESVKRLPLKNFLDLLVREPIDGLMKLLSDTVSLSWKTVNGRVFYPYTVQWSYVAFQLRDKFKNVIYGENDKTLASLGWQYEEARGGISVEAIKKLGAKSRFSDLSQDELYNLLKSVSDRNIQPTKDFYKKINAAFVELEKAGQKICPPVDLKVFAAWKEGENDRFAFCPVGEVFYHDNPAHARQLVRDRKMFFLGARVGVDSVCRHFGVQKLDERLALVRTKTGVAEDLQSAFKNDLLQRNSALSVILSRNTSESLGSCRGRIEGVDIQLVTSLCYSYDNGPDQNLPVYGYIRDRNSGTFYLCVGQLHDLSQLDNTGLRRFARSLAGVFCDAVRSANDELQRQFEACFFDLETAKEDLRDLGYENDLDMVVATANYYRKYQSEFKNLSDTLWALFLKPIIWKYMEERKNLQKYYRACELKYLDYVSRASEYNGELYQYCVKHQKDSLSDDKLRDAFVEFLKHGQKQWMLPACEGLEFVWDRIEQMPNDLPTFEDNYSDLQDADLLQGADGEVSDEYLSLMSFPGITQGFCL